MKRLLPLLLFTQLLTASCHRLFLGPDMPIYLTRTRESGSHQHGFLYGAEGGYERSRPFGFYWSLRGYYAKGTLKGFDPRGARLESRQTEGEIEGRFGYTIAWSNPLTPSLTPFLAYGGFSEHNDFSAPSPIALCYRNSFRYTALGLLSSSSCGPFSIGFVGKVIFMANGKCRVTDDPFLDDVTIRMNNELHYRIELPLSYAFCNWQHTFRCSAVPYWWYRHYGERCDWPFDYIGTRIQIWGLRLVLSTLF